MEQLEMQHCRKVLVVEDDPFIAMDIVDDLSDRGFEVIANAADVETARAALDDNKPDFAILDFNLGKATSEPIAHKLNEMAIPFVFVTGNTEAVQKLAQIAAPILTKPIDMELVLATIST